jgi:type VI protein secretion system component VasK
MSAPIWAILAALVPLVVWFIRRRAARRDDPANQKEEHHEQIAREIIHNDEAGANRSLDDDLRRLRALQSHQQRPDRPPDQGQ